MMLLKGCKQCVSNFGKLHRGHRTGKGQFPFQYQRRSMTRNVQTTALCSQFTCQQGSAQNPSSQNSVVGDPKTSRSTGLIQKRQMNQIKLSTFSGSLRKRGSSRNKKQKFFSRFIDYAKGFECVDHNTLWKILKDLGIPDYLFLDKPVC